MRWRRWTWIMPVVLLLVVVSGFLAYQTVRPGEWVTAATRPYPEVAPSPVPGVIASLRAAPLIVDRRLRVSTSTHDVWAELLDAPDGVTPFWSYHKFPAQVVNAVAVDAEDGAPPVVVVKLSGGRLIGIDATTGRVAWRATVGAAVGDDNHGGPTGVQTLYGTELNSLFTAADARGHAVVINAGDSSADAFDPSTGRRLWHLDTPDCLGVTWTGPTVFVAVQYCGEPRTLHLYDAGTGHQLTTWRPQKDPDAIDFPTGCSVATSRCDGFDAGGAGGSWRIHPDGTLTAVSDRDPPTVAADIGDVTLRRADSGRRTIRAVSRVDGSELWSRSFDADIDEVAADGTAAYVITRDRLSRLDPRTGAVEQQVALPSGASESVHVYATDGYVVIDQSNFDFTDRNAAWSLPGTARPVLLIAT
ncbi:PQQ-binding-like beta-propeller repeat protein [Dactylosporangium sp. CA-139066]|uniref:outer membrane protein assembly factor BamB family protein n=1 Tax=Dactylosporangium sp. CA-139066 TaxID=3239930 RepID=UPI003D8FCB65